MVQLEKDTISAISLVERWDGVREREAGRGQDAGREGEKEVEFENS